MNVAGSQSEVGSPGRLARLRARVFGAGWRDALLGGALSGAGLVLSFPPLSLWPACLLVVWPLCRVCDAVVRREWSARLAAFWAAVGAAPAWAWLVRWAVEASVAGFPFLIAYLSLYTWLAVWVITRLRRAGWPAIASVPLGWLGVEFLRGHLAFEGFPWFLSAQPMIDAPALSWPASLGGVYLVGGLLALAAAWVDGVAFGPRRVWSIAVGALLLAGWGGWGALWIAGDSPGSGTLRVGLIQTNVPQSIRHGWATEDRWEDWLTMRALLTRAAGYGGGPPDVLVAPETMFPGFVLQADGAEEEKRVGVAWSIAPDPETGQARAIRAETVRDDLLDTQEALGIPLLMGATRHEGFRIEPVGDRLSYESDRRFNGVFLLEGGGVSKTTYDKRTLTPFGEVMPYISAIPWLERALTAVGARGMRFDLAAGEARTVFEIPFGEGVARVVTPICYEATVGGACRDLVFDRGGMRRADLLVNMTNDGWFYDAAGGRAFHLLASRWRCVELDTAMARSANTGISAIVDRRGVVVESLPPWTSGALMGEVELGGGVTPYARFGELPGRVGLTVTAVGVGVSFAGRRGKKSNGSGPG